MKLLLTFIYIFINSLFILKYSHNKLIGNECLIFGLYILLVLVLISSFNKIKLAARTYKLLFFTLVISFFTASVLLNILVDGNTLNTDRWSAMDVAINALFNNEYPYSAIDHMGGRTSNFPFLIFIGIPFNLMGDVGYLQSFCFLILSYVVFKIFPTYKSKLFCLLLLIISPAYLWEIYAKSDLMSNLIILLSFVTLSYKVSLHKKKNLIFYSFLSTALLYTRSVTIIPLVLAFFKRFVSLNFRQISIYITILISTIALSTFICFKNYGSVDHFMANNPFTLQNRQSNILVSLITIVLPFIYSFKTNSLKKLTTYSMLLLIFPVVIPFYKNISAYGINKTLFESFFDISYFNMSFPFLIIALGLYYLKIESPKTTI